MPRGYRTIPEPDVMPEVAEVKPEVKVESKPEPVQNTQTIVLRSELDAYISERLKEQPKTIEAIEVKFNDTTTKAQHVLSLPYQLEKYVKDYSFRWINKKKRAIDHAIDVIGWTFVTSDFFNDVPKRLFTVNGVIERGDAILAFMPQARAERIRLRPAEISRERVKQTPVQDLRKWKDRGEKYYKPDLGAAENDNEVSRGMVMVPDDVKEQE